MWITFPSIHLSTLLGLRPSLVSLPLARLCILCDAMGKHKALCHCEPTAPSKAEIGKAPLSGVLHSSQPSPLFPSLHLILFVILRTMHLCKYFLCLVIASFLASSRVVLSEDNEAHDENDNPDEEINDSEYNNDEPEELHSDASLQEASSYSSELDVETLLETFRQAERFLKEIAPQVNVDSTLEEVEELIEKSHRLEALHAQVQEKRQAVDELLRIANTRQLDQHLLPRLNRTLERELTLRKAQGHAEHGAVTTETEFEPVSMDDLKRAFETKSLMKESEAMLQQWVIGIMEEELAALAESHASSSLEGKVECATRLEVVHDVQAALTKHSQDGIGMVDYAQGATIIHEMTSASYIPPPAENELLGKVWWGNYIAEDWEQLLPQGWQEWNVGIPSFVYHALVRSTRQTNLCVCVFYSCVSPLVVQCVRCRGFEAPRQPHPILFFTAIYCPDRVGLWMEPVVE
jgi:hypothetical protein